VAGALLLGWLGTGGLDGTDRPEVIAASTTDIVAHATGFFVGAVLGAGAAVTAVRKRLARVPQWASGIAAAGVIAIAWSVALSS
jgi:energy-converting hydrogenase Eha subunit G